MIKTEAKADEYRNFSMKVGDEVYVSAFIGDCTITKIDDEFVTVTTKVYKHNIYNK